MSNGRRFKRSQYQFVKDAVKAGTRKRGCNCGCAVNLVNERGSLVPTVHHRPTCRLVELGEVQ